MKKMCFSINSVFLLLILSLTSCVDKSKVWYEEFKPIELKSIDDFVEHFGEPESVDTRLFDIVSENPNRNPNSTLGLRESGSKIDESEYGGEKLISTEERTVYLFLIKEETEDCSGGSYDFKVEVNVNSNTPTSKKLKSRDSYIPEKFINGSLEGNLKTQEILLYEAMCYTSNKGKKEIEKSRERIEKWMTQGSFVTYGLSGTIIGSYQFSSDKTYVYFTSLLGGFSSKGTWEIKNGFEPGEAQIFLYPPKAQVDAGNVPSRIILDAYEEGKIISNGETKYSLK